jgi:hypothetical protein
MEQIVKDFIHQINTFFHSPFEHLNFKITFNIKILKVFAFHDKYLAQESNFFSGDYNDLAAIDFGPTHGYGKHLWHLHLSNLRVIKILAGDDDKLFRSDFNQNV